MQAILHDILAPREHEEQRELAEDNAQGSHRRIGVASTSAGSAKGASGKGASKGAATSAGSAKSASGKGGRDLCRLDQGRLEGGRLGQGRLDLCCLGMCCDGPAEAPSCAAS